MKEWYLIKEKATGIVWVRSDDYNEILEIYNNINKDKEVFKNFRKKDFVLINNRGVIIYE